MPDIQPRENLSGRATLSNYFSISSSQIFCIFIPGNYLLKGGSGQEERERDRARGSSFEEQDSIPTVNHSMTWTDTP